MVRKNLAMVETTLVSFFHISEQIDATWPDKVDGEFFAVAKSRVHSKVEKFRLIFSEVREWVIQQLEQKHNVAVHFTAFPFTGKRIDLNDLLKRYGISSLQQHTLAAKMGQLLSPQELGEYINMLKTFCNAVTAVDLLDFAEEKLHFTTWSNAFNTMIKLYLGTIQWIFDGVSLGEKEGAALVQMLLVFQDSIFEPIYHAFTKKDFRYVIKGVLVERVASIQEVLLQQKPSSLAERLNLIEAFIAPLLKDLREMAVKHAQHAPSFKKFYTPIEAYHTIFYAFVDALRSQEDVCDINVTKLQKKRIPEQFWQEQAGAPSNRLSPMKSYYNEMVRYEPFLASLALYRDTIFKAWLTLKKGQPIVQNNIDAITQLDQSLQKQGLKPDRIFPIPFALVDAYVCLQAEWQELRRIQAPFRALRAAPKGPLDPYLQHYMAIAPILESYDGILRPAIKAELEEIRQKFSNIPSDEKKKEMKLDEKKEEMKQ